MTKQKRRKFTPQDKVAILKEHLVDGRAVSEVCDKHQLNPNQFYQWQKQFFENGAEAFRAPKANPQERVLRQKVATAQHNARTGEVVLLGRDAGVRERFDSPAASTQRLAPCRWLESWVFVVGRTCRRATGEAADGCA